MAVTSRLRTWALPVVLLAGLGSTGCKSTSWSMPSWPKWGSSASTGKHAEGLAVTKPSSIVPPAKNVASAKTSPYGTPPTSSASSVQPAGASMAYNPNSPPANYASPATGNPSAGVVNAGGTAPASYPATPQAFSFPTAPAGGATATPPTGYAPPAGNAQPAGNYPVGPYGGASLATPSNTQTAGAYAAPPAVTGQTQTTYGQPYTGAGMGGLNEPPVYGAPPANNNYAAAPIETSPASTPVAPAANYQQPNSGSMVQPASPTGTMATRNTLPPSLTGQSGGYRPGSTGSVPSTGSYPSTTGGTMYR